MEEKQNLYEELALAIQEELPAVKIPEIDGFNIGIYRKFSKRKAENFYDFIKTDNSLQILLGNCYDQSLGRIFLPILQLYLLRTFKSPAQTVHKVFNHTKDVLLSHKLTSNLKISLLGCEVRFTDDFCTVINSGETSVFMVKNNSKNTTSTVLKPTFGHFIGENNFSSNDFYLEQNDKLILACPVASRYLSNKIIQNELKENKYNDLNKLAKNLANAVINSGATKNSDIAIIVVESTQILKKLSRELTMENSASAIPHMRKFISSLLMDFPFNTKSSNELVLCIDEALSNCVRYGQSTNPQNNVISLKWQPIKDGIRFEIIDNGPGFSADLEKWKPPDVDSEKGRGIYIMRSLLDNFLVEDIGSGTKVVMEKKFL